MGEGERVERRPVVGLLQRRGRVLRHFDIARCRVELEHHGDLVATRHSGLGAVLAASGNMNCPPMTATVLRYV